MGGSFESLASARLVPASEQEFALRLSLFGRPTVLSRGRYWVQTTRGFFEPINLLARLDAQELGRPTWWCWGFRTSLSETCAHLANGSMPMNLLSNLDTYTAEGLPAKRRSDLRKSEKTGPVAVLYG